MIRFLLFQNTSGCTRISKYYTPLSDNEKVKTEYEVFKILRKRPENTHASFVEFGVDQLIYKKYGSVYVVMCCDSMCNELCMLEALHLMLETINEFFSNHLCELDLIFGFHKIYLMLDEFILGGEIVETSKRVMLDRLKELDEM